MRRAGAAHLASLDADADEDARDLDGGLDDADLRAVHRDQRARQHDERRQQGEGRPDSSTADIPPRRTAAAGQSLVLE